MGRRGKQSPEIIERRIAPLRGRKRPPEVGSAISAALRGRKITWGDKISAALSGRSPILSVEQRAALAERSRAIFNRLHAENKFSGEGNGRAKLTWEKVTTIRELWATGQFTQQSLADRYGVRQMAISRVVRGVTWKV